MTFKSTLDPEDPERKLMVTKKVVYPGMAHYFPQMFGEVATQIGAVHENLNSVYKTTYFVRSSSLHQPSTEACCASW